MSNHPMVEHVDLGLVEFVRYDGATRTATVRTSDNHKHEVPSSTLHVDPSELDRADDRAIHGDIGVPLAQVIQ